MLTISGVPNLILLSLGVTQHFTKTFISDWSSKLREKKKSGLKGHKLKILLGDVGLILVLAILLNLISALHKHAFKGWLLLLLRGLIVVKHYWLKDYSNFLIIHIMLAAAL